MKWEYGGGVREWFNRTVLKTVVSEMAPWVRIPPPPPCFYAKRCENPLASAKIENTATIL